MYHATLVLKRGLHKWDENKAILYPENLLTFVITAASEHVSYVSTLR